MLKKFWGNLTSPRGSRSPNTPNGSKDSLDTMISPASSSSSSKKSPSATYWNLFSKSKQSTPAKTSSNSSTPSVKELNTKFLEAMKVIEEEETPISDMTKPQVSSKTTPSRPNQKKSSSGNHTISLDFYVQRALAGSAQTASPSQQIDKTATIHKNVTLIGDIIIKAHTIIYPNVIIENLGEGRIEIGEHNIICSQVQIRNKSHDTMTIGNGNQFCIGSIIEALHIGNANRIGCRAVLDSTTTIQDKCTIGEHCSLIQGHLLDETILPNNLVVHR